MKALVFAGVAASTLMLGGLAPAEARDGCGPFAHLSVYGVCRPNAVVYGAMATAGRTGTAMVGVDRMGMGTAGAVTGESALRPAKVI